MFTPRPVHRSRLRMALGTVFFSLRRHIKWRFSRTRWASRRKDPATLPEVIFEHRTPLFRALRDVPLHLQQGKVTNLKIAIAKMGGICIAPGETFSYWKLIGPPSARRGFVPGMALHNGVLQEEVAGGLCQLSNLLYWMVLHTPLTVVERWRHNYDVFPDAGRTLPFGSGATCFYNYVDLQFANCTDQPFLLHLFMTETHLVGQWRSDRPVPFRYQVYESHHEFRHEPWGGYTRHNELRRKVLSRAGEELSDHLVTQNHAIMMYEPLLTDGS
ncbi:MAG TPA: VanW family protein [Symbiobacteriaceae bacterium]|nr:VanW family protein [Symbiobacteriaceae bacterium]